MAVACCWTDREHLLAGSSSPLLLKITSLILSEPNSLHILLLVDLPFALLNNSFSMDTQDSQPPVPPVGGANPRVELVTLLDRAVSYDHASVKQQLLQRSPYCRQMSSKQLKRKVQHVLRYLQQKGQQVARPNAPLPISTNASRSQLPLPAPIALRGCGLRMDWVRHEFGSNDKR